MKESGLTRVVVLILLAAGLVYVPLSRGPSTDRVTEPAVAVATTGAADRDTSPRPSLIGGDSAHGGDVPDALTLLGEFVNLDVTPPAVLRYAEQIIDQIPELCRAEPSEKASKECLARLSKATGLLRGLRMSDIGLHQRVSDRAGHLVDCVERESEKDTSRGNASVEKKRDCAQAEMRRSADFLLEELKRARIEPATDELLRKALGTVSTGRTADEDEAASRSSVTEALATAAVKETIVGDLGYQVHFLIATLADACDSYTGGAFDPALEAIRRAVEVDGYGLDRFYFPDWKPGTSPNQTGSQCTGTLHEQHPGVVVFRRGSPDSLLVLFTIPENATAGIHPAAFVRAIRFITRWDNAPTANLARKVELAIRVIGPTFSGSSASLARTIHAMPPGLAGGYDFDIVSGSATDADNLKELTIGETVAHGQVRFGATTISDNPMVERLNSFLAEIGVPKEDTAQLFESNTTYGGSIKEILEKLQGPLLLTFPLHISRVRSLSPQASASPATRLQLNESRPLALEDAQTPKDLLPPLRPDMTTPSAELMLRNLLHTVRQEGVRAVGIFATDIRDKLFLARELHRRAPDALVYTSESDVLFAHPSSTPYTRGMLVVSSYPLYSRNQAWTVDKRSRMEFPSMFAAGTYNATLVHLRALNPGADLPLSEFGLPFENCGEKCVPPVWINIVGRNRLWPVDVSKADQHVGWDSRYTPERKSSNAGTPERVDFETPVLAALLFVCLTAFSLLHVVAFWGRSRWVASAPFFRRFVWHRPSPASDDVTVPEPRRSEHVDRSRPLLACLVALTLLHAAASGLFWTWFVFGTEDQPWIVFKTFLLAFTVCALGGLLITTARVAWRTVADFLHQVGASRTGDQAARWGRVIYRAGSATVAVLAVAFGAAYVAGLWPHQAWHTAPGPDDLRYVLLFERATALTSGVSPLVPLLLLTSAAYLCGALHLSPFGAARDLRMTDRLIGWSRPVSTFTDGLANRIQFPVTLALVLMTVVLACWWTLGPRWPVTIEGWSFNAMIFWTVILLQVLIAAGTARLLHDHRLVQEYLDGLAGDPVVAACERLPENVVTPSRLFMAPRLSEAGLLARKWKELENRLPIPAEVVIESIPSASVEEPRALVPSTNDYGRLRSASRQIQEAFRVERSIPGAAWQESLTRVRLRSATLDLRSLSRGREGSRQLTPFDDPATREAAEDCLALQTVFGLREAFSHMASKAAYIMAAAVLLLASHTLYPMQPRQTLLAITWANIGVALAVGLAGLVAIDRNRVLSTITCMPRGAVNWNWALARRIAVFAMLPLISVIAAQFPELAATIFNWIEPMQAVLF